MFGSSSSTGKIKALVIGVQNANANANASTWAMGWYCIHVHAWTYDKHNDHRRHNIRTRTCAISTRAQYVQYAPHMQIHFAFQINWSLKIWNDFWMFFFSFSQFVQMSRRRRRTTAFSFIFTKLIRVNRSGACMCTLDFFFSNVFKLHTQNLIRKFIFSAFNCTQTNELALLLIQTIDRYMFNIHSVVCRGKITITRINESASILWLNRKLVSTFYTQNAKISFIHWTNNVQKYYNFFRQRRREQKSNW